MHREISGGTLSFEGGFQVLHAILLRLLKKIAMEFITGRSA